MSGALFLGSSHVAAFKLAHDTIDPHNLLNCTFACARGADLAFTRVEAGMLRASDTAEFDEETIAYAFPGWMEAHYLQQGIPTEPVAAQFFKTNGHRQIDVSCISVIFYAVGVSPYDFIRLKENITPISARMRRQVLGRMLADRHILRRQVEDIRRCNPGCAHHLIAMPLKAIVRPEPTDTELEIVELNRDLVRKHASEYLFDDVYMPDHEVLDHALLSTRAEFTPGGCAASELFQQDPAPILTDRQHMNNTYGELVFEAFVRSRLPK